MSTMTERRPASPVVPATAGVRDLLQTVVPRPVLARAEGLLVHAQAAGVFVVGGGASAHWVMLTPDIQCDCEDHAMTGALCKHLSAVLLSLDDIEVARTTCRTLPLRAPRHTEPR